MYSLVAYDESSEKKSFKFLFLRPLFVHFFVETLYVTGPFVNVNMMVHVEFKQSLFLS